MGFGFFLGGLGGIFVVSKVWGVCRTRGRIGCEVDFFVFLAVQGVFLWLICKK